MATTTVVLFEDQTWEGREDGSGRTYYSSPQLNAVLESIASVSKTLFFGIAFRDFTETSADSLNFKIELEHTNDGVHWATLTVPVVTSAQGIASTYDGIFKMVSYSQTFGNKIRAKLTIEDTDTQSPGLVHLTGAVTLSGKPV